MSSKLFTVSLVGSSLPPTTMTFAELGRWIDGNPFYREGVDYTVAPAHTHALEVGAIVSQGMDVLRVTKVWVDANGNQCAKFEEVNE